MAQGTKENRLSPKRVMRSLLLSTGIAIALLVFLEFKDNGCYVFETGQVGALFSAFVVWILVLTFFILSWFWRAIFGSCVIIIFFFRPGIVRWPMMAVAQAVWTREVRTAQVLLEAYKREHPQEGFPSQIPSIYASAADFGLEKSFKFEYQLIRGAKDGPAVDYILRVAPVRRGCGFHLNLLTSQDGVIHITHEDRPATSADPAIVP